MKVRTIFQTIVLCITLNFISCKSTAGGSAPVSVEEAEKQIAKKRKKEAKTAKREKRQNDKAYWKRQSKSAKKSVKKNAKRQRKIIRKKKRQGEYDYQDQERWVK